jgi:hypothetical protein
VKRDSFVRGRELNGVAKDVNWDGEGGRVCLSGVGSTLYLLPIILG